MSSSVSSHSAVATVMSSSVSSRSAVATVMSSSVSSRSAVAASQCSETTGDSELTAEDVSTVRKGRLILDEEESDAGCYQVCKGCLATAVLTAIWYFRPRRW